MKLGGLLLPFAVLSNQEHLWTGYISKPPAPCVTTTRSMGRQDWPAHQLFAHRFLHFIHRVGPFSMLLRMPSLAVFLPVLGRSRFRTSAEGAESTRALDLLETSGADVTVLPLSTRCSRPQECSRMLKRHLKASCVGVERILKNEQV